MSSKSVYIRIYEILFTVCNMLKCTFLCRMPPFCKDCTLTLEMQSYSWLVPDIVYVLLARN